MKTTILITGIILLVLSTLYLGYNIPFTKGIPLVLSTLIAGIGVGLILIAADMQGNLF